MSHTHFSREELNALLDGALSETQLSFMHGELDRCGRCRSMYRSLAAIDGALKKVKREGVADDFTETVMKKIGVAPQTPWIFRLFENAAYAFGLLIVLGMMAAAFILSGVIDADQVSSTQTVAQTTLSELADGFSAHTGTFSAWLRQYMPFAFGKGSLSIAITGTVILLFLGVLDKLVLRKYIHKLR